MQPLRVLAVIANLQKGSMEGIRRARGLLQRIYLYIQGLVEVLHRLLQAQREYEPRQETFNYHLSSQLVNY